MVYIACRNTIILKSSVSGKQGKVMSGVGLDFKHALDLFTYCMERIVHVLKTEGSNGVILPYFSPINDGACSIIGSINFFCPKIHIMACGLE